MSYINKKKCSLFLMLFWLKMLDSADLAASTSCPMECGGIHIPFPFGIGKGCYLNKYYEIECRNSNTSTKVVPFLPKISKEVVNISILDEEKSYVYLSFGYIRVRSPIISAGCITDEKASQEVNLTGSPFFTEGTNSLVGLGCNSSVSLKTINRNMVGCELNCRTSKEFPSNSNSIPFIDETGCSNNALSYTTNKVCTENKPEEETGCSGNRCCQASLPYEAQQVFDIRIERKDVEQCSVAFLTDFPVYTVSNATKRDKFFAKRDAVFTLGWVIQTSNDSFLNSLGCKSETEYRNASYSIRRKTKCYCKSSTSSDIHYADCRCNYGYTGNPYTPDGCKDIDECEIKHYFCGEGEACVNSPGSVRCVVDKSRSIVIGVGTCSGILALLGGVWWLRKLQLKRRLEKRKKEFFKRNGGQLLQQEELNTGGGNVEKTRIFSSRELLKATDNFSENRVLGKGGQGTVYKGMLVDGRTVAIKKSKIIDEDKVQEFINEVVILSQINHRHVVKLLGCCLETDVPILVYEYIVNGNLFQHIHEETDDHRMVWRTRLRIGADIAGAVAYLHSAAASPVYHRDLKSTNILLDEKFRAKVSDFGTSRSVSIDQTHRTATAISGTAGYVDPECYESSQYTEKSDVYSFGVILAELITGEKPVITVENTGEVVSLAKHFRLTMKQKRLSDVMDTRIRGECKLEEVVAVANLAMKCLNSKRKNRPNMREVFAELERISTSREDSQVQIQIDEDEEDVIKQINRSDTAPASSSSDVEWLLYPRLTW